MDNKAYISRFLMAADQIGHFDSWPEFNIRFDLEQDFVFDSSAQYSGAY